MMSTHYNFEVNGSNQTSISSGYQKGSRIIRFWVLTIVKFVVYVLILIPGMFINMKFLNNLKHEQRKEGGQTIQRIMKNVSIAQMIFWPIFLFLRMLIGIDLSLQILSLNPCFYHYVGLIMRFAYHVVRLYIGFHSLVVAICRICFILYEHVVSNYGIDKFKKIIYYGSIMVPLGIAILAQGTIPTQNRLIPITVSRCTGVVTNFNDTKMDNQSPIYAFVQNNVSSHVTTSIEVFCYTMVFIILSNTIEGIIYLYVWSYSKR